MQFTRRTLLGAPALGAVAMGALAPKAHAWQESGRYPDPAIVTIDPSFAKYRLNNAGVELEGLDVRHPSLEDVFLELTADNGGDGR